MRRVALVGQQGTTRSSRRARLARHVFRGVATAWTGVVMSTSLFLEVVPEIDTNLDIKSKLVHTSTTASSSSAMVEQSRLDSLEMSLSYVSCRVETWRDVTWRAKWNFGLCFGCYCSIRLVQKNTFTYLLKPKLHSARHVTSLHDTTHSTCQLMHFGCVELVEQHGSTRSSRRARHVEHV